MSYDAALAISMVFLVGAVILFIVLQSQRSERSKALIQTWARERGYTVLEMEEAQFTGRGDFFWTTSKGQTVYTIVVADAQGRQRRGRIRCGHRWWGMSAPQTEVRWDG